jgi:fatty-acyl-CoA synthase
MSIDPAVILSPDDAWRRQLAREPQGAAVNGPEGALDRLAFEALIQEEQTLLHREGVGPGDIVAWLGHNSARQLAALLACERLGAALMPLNWRLAHGEWLACLEHAGVACLRVMPELQASGEALRRDWMASSRGGPRHASAQPGDLLLVYTSGTTGEPRGALHTASGMAANARAAIAVQAFGTATRCLAVLPMFHVGGLCIQLLPALLAGSAIRLHARFDPGAWLADVEAWRPTTSLMVPATMRAVLEHPRWAQIDLSSLVFVNSGSSVVPLALIEAFHRRGTPVAQVYGSTETGPFSIASLPAEAMAHPASTGRPAPGVQIRLVDAQGKDVPRGTVGEILVRGDNLMRAYHRMPDHPDFLDGWFHSGDLARQDAEGRFEVVGRSKDLIISGGENIYPAEIENLVASLAGVAECAVVGVPDARWGEVPVLAVVPSVGATLDLARLSASFEGRLARFKHPRRIVLVDELPKTALGKVRKALLARRLGEDAG